MLSYNETLTQEIIDYIGVENKEWNWKRISSNVILTLPFIKKYIDKLYIEYLSRNKTLTLDIMDYISIDDDKWDLEEISKNINFKNL